MIILSFCFFDICVVTIVMPHLMYLMDWKRPTDHMHKTRQELFREAHSYIYTPFWLSSVNIILISKWIHLIWNISSFNFKYFLDYTPKFFTVKTYFDELSFNFFNTFLSKTKPFNDNIIGHVICMAFVSLNTMFTILIDNLTSL